MKKLTTKEFIEKASKVHNNKYDYSLVEYKNCRTKIKIICSEHGIFKQTPDAHLNQLQGCKKCSINNKKFSIQEFIERASKVHNNKYDYSLVEYKNCRTKIKIICSIHGIFKQTPDAHLNQLQGCKKCSIEKRGKYQTLTIEEFIHRANNIYNNKYDYSVTIYIHSQKHVKIICPIHGIFKQTPEGHLRGNGCNMCSKNISKPELEICAFLDSKTIDYEQSNRSILNGKELDIVIPSFKLAIEFNGIYWHSEQVLKNNNKNPIRYHQEKYLGCKKEGHQLLSIFEPEWIFKKEIIKSIILAKLNIYETKIGARKCKIKIINSKISKDFFNNNHIQGFFGGKHFGLYYKDQLVSAISFRKNKEDYELTRFVNKKNTLVHGAFSKLLKCFINNYNFNSIYTFADLRYFEGKVYLKNGFKFVHEVDPSYYYFRGKSYLLHKRGFQKKILKKKFNTYNPELTEYRNCLNNGYDRVWDCGKLKFKTKGNI